MRERFALINQNSTRIATDDDQRNRRCNSSSRIRIKVFDWLQFYELTDLPGAAAVLEEGGRRCCKASHMRVIKTVLLGTHRRQRKHVCGFHRKILTQNEQNNK